jgi:hypothetical protein
MNVGFNQGNKRRNHEKYWFVWIVKTTSCHPRTDVWNNLKNKRFSVSRGKDSKHVSSQKKICNCCNLLWFEEFYLGNFDCKLSAIAMAIFKKEASSNTLSIVVCSTNRCFADIIYCNIYFLLLLPYSNV